MSKSKNGKTELQRDILLTWYENPHATKKEISDACDCSASYVSNVTNRFEDYNQMESMLDRQDKELERMFGDDIFQEFGTGSAAIREPAAEGPGLIDIYTQQPDNLAGYLVRVGILLFLLFIFYQVAAVLVL